MSSKVMFLYPNHEGYFRAPVGLTLIMTVTEIAGHEVKLFDTTFMNVSENKDDAVRVKSGQVKPVSMDNYFTKKSKEQIENAWLDEIEKFSPDLIATTIVEDSYEFADRLLNIAKKNLIFQLSLVVVCQQ